MDLIASGYITSNKIEFTEVLEERFKSNWKRYVKEDSVFNPNSRFTPLPYKTNHGFLF